MKQLVTRSKGRILPLDDTYDIFIVGGGVNGCGIARDAAGRGLNVALAEMDDIGSATSSASTKLFHGGLRYLEYFELSLVRKALIEREILLKAMPHISWPMRFVLPYHKDMRFEGSTPASRLLGAIMPWMRGRRPAWMIRFGLFLYDNLGGREILPGTKTVNLQDDPVGKPLLTKFSKAFEYSDCWVEDARLVSLNARDAKERGAKIMTRTKVTSVVKESGVWAIHTEGSKGNATFHAKVLVNAAGPWVDGVTDIAYGTHRPEDIRLVRGSHIVTKRLFDHDKCYFFQGTDGRIIFAIPYETDFTLIGTTDAEHADAASLPVCTPEEQEYLCNFASEYFEKPVTVDDIVWTYSGVRGLYDDGSKSASATTREYVIRDEDVDGLPLLNIFGGKITTYRKLAESVLDAAEPYVEKMGGRWTAGAPLPGGDFAFSEKGMLLAHLKQNFQFLHDAWAERLFKAYGAEAAVMLAGTKSKMDLGIHFGHNLWEVEVRWLMEKEFAQTADDVVWRRSKLGLRLSDAEILALDTWMKSAAATTQKV